MFFFLSIYPVPHLFRKWISRQPRLRFKVITTAEYILEGTAIDQRHMYVKNPQSYL